MNLQKYYFNRIKMQNFMDMFRGSDSQKNIAQNPYGVQQDPYGNHQSQTHLKNRRARSIAAPQTNDVNYSSPQRRVPSKMSSYGEMQYQNSPSKRFGKYASNMSLNKIDPPMYTN